MPQCLMKIFQVLLRQGSLELGIEVQLETQFRLFYHIFPGISSSTESLLQIPQGNGPTAMGLQLCLDIPLGQQLSKTGPAGTPARSFLFFFLRSYIFIFRERGKRGRKREKHQCVVASHVSPTGHLACDPSMCPDWESNRQPFGSQAGTQTTEPHQPGQIFSCDVTEVSLKRLRELALCLMPFIEFLRQTSVERCFAVTL